MLYVAPEDIHLADVRRFRIYKIEWIGMEVEMTWENCC